MTVYLARFARGGARHCGMLLCGVLLFLTAASPVRAQVPVTSAMPPVAPSRSVPTDFYFAALRVYYDGDLSRALKAFQSASRSSIKNGTNRWIDSICYHTMTGECYYQMGQMAEALAEYDAALQLYITHSEFLIPCQFSPTIRPAGVGSVKPVPWGQSKRNTRQGQFPGQVQIAQGQVDHTQVLQRGGVVQQAVLYSINPQEILRCTGLALRRRRELMGPACPYDARTLEMIAVLTRRQVQPNHWSEAWIDVLQGMAYSAGGKYDQAVTVLKRGLITGGEFDHPLTPMALVELGRIALARGEYDQALQYFDESTYAAAYFQDGDSLESAFRGALEAHAMANRRGAFAPALPAAEWARANNYRHFQAAVLILGAENACLERQPKQAQQLLDQARSVIARRDMGQARLGARMAYVQAVTAYQAGNAAAAATALRTALDFYSTGGNWLFQLALADDRFARGALSERAAMDVFAELLRDPQPQDWLRDPLETLSVQSHAHPRYFERWFEVAVRRSDFERALEIADLARRHRFLSSLELGGRLLQLQWVLEGPTEMLSPQVQLQRQELLVRYPDYAQLQQQARTLREQLRQGPAVATESEASRRQSALLGELASVSRQQESILAEVAVRREAADVVFPPLRTTQQVRQSLPDGHALLTFFNAGTVTYGFLLTNDKYGYWPVSGAAAVPKALGELLRDLGNYDQNKTLKLADLTNEAWQRSAREVRELLMKDSKVELPYDFQELTIVPEGLLWYVPFEALTTASGDGGPLLTQLRIRYAPTMGLAVGDPRPRSQTGATGIVLGKLYPSDSSEAAELGFEDCRRSMPGALAVRGPLPAPGGVYSTLFNTLVVLAEIPTTAGALDWTPIPVDRTAQGNTLADWMRLPWGKPDYLLLPGFHTAAESGLRKPTPNSGHEMFLAACGVMSTGTRTLLISRWRPGGQSSRDLARELAQELPYMSAAEAWQRAVLLVSRTPIDPMLEPRIQLDPTDQPPAAQHPFFWSAFSIVDTGTVPATDPADEAEGLIQIKPKDPASEAEGAIQIQPQN